MVKKFLSLIVICLIIAGVAHLANQRRLTGLLESGETTSLDQSAPASSSVHPPLPSAQPLPRLPQTLQPPIAQPVADTIPANPSNGMVFSGSGPFQLYRQGNLTWRVDTGSGKSCILFATDAEWRKPRVYQQGCATT